MTILLCGGKSMSIILVVDDEEAIRHLLYSVLHDQQGHKVMTAASGQEALDILKHHMFDIYLINYLMPGMNGDELIKTLRKDNDVTPIIAYTGHALISVQDMIKWGANMGISGVWEIRDMILAIKKLTN
jgi:CheY-like chemotaxis protein